jgi:hypothetical protein
VDRGDILAVFDEGREVLHGGDGRGGEDLRLVVGGQGRELGFERILADLAEDEIERRAGLEQAGRSAARDAGLLMP